MPSTWILIRELWGDKSLMRIYLNHALQEEMLSGRVLDVGQGSNPAYLDFMKRTEGTTVQGIDPKAQDPVDFEKDALPYNEGEFDTVLALNVLEHVFNYDHLLKEMYRVLKREGSLIGYTPFLVRYHPDPHDFFRYTNEALEKMLARAGFKDIEIVPIGHGPFLVALNVLVLSIPRPLRVLLALKALLLDSLFLRLRPKARAIYPMGYYFKAKR